MEMHQKIVVLYAGQYAVVDDKTHEKKEGVSIAYLYGDNLDAVTHPGGSKGQRPAKASFAPGMWDKFTSVPGVYDGIFEPAIGSDGKPVLRLVGVEFLSLVSLTPVKPSVKAKAEMGSFPMEVK